MSERKPSVDWNVVAAGEGRVIRLANNAEIIVKEDGSHTRGGLVVAEMVIQPDFSAPPQHLHNAREEAWYVLDGEIDFTSGTRVRRVGPGDWVVVPLGVPHTFATAGDTPARFLTTFTPRLYLDYFVELTEKTASALQETGLSPREVVPGISAEIMPNYETEVIIDPAEWEKSNPR
jgi:mannose-6-phosphate isomerase-like protein (cupin superfamily)